MRKKVFLIFTYCGRSSDWNQLDLKPTHVDNLNEIGYRKKLYGKEMNFEEYLNGLDDGNLYIVNKTKHDTGDFCETYFVTKIF